MDTRVDDSMSDKGWVERELVAMAGRLDELRSQGADVSSQDLVAELETAMEELRVTGEEVAAQQRHISDLLRESSLVQATVERLVVAMPAPVLLTDVHGGLLDANPAAARLLGAPPERLRGKPLVAFVDVADRRTVRVMVQETAVGRTPQPATVQMTPRGAPPLQATLVAVPTPADSGSRTPAGARWFADVTTPNDGGGSGLALLGSFAELISLPPAHGTGADLFPQIAEIAERALPEASDVTITVGDPRQPRLLSSSSQRAQAVDAAQYEAAEGPCVEAFLTDQVVGSDDLRHDPRWPTLARCLGNIPVNATLGVPIHGEAGVLGVMNLYGPPGARLDTPPVRAHAALFARATSALLEDSQRVEMLREEARHLRQALVSRPEIDQAKGILMARFGYSADDAFRHLVAVSQKRNVKLRDIARDIVGKVQEHRGPPTSTG
jgi:PAS domain-containing protein